MKCANTKVSDQKRQAIIAAAEACFLSEGFNGCSMDRIALDADVAKQTIYAHFNNKTKLFQEVMSNLCNESSPCPFEDKDISEIDVEEFIREFSYAVLSFMCQPKVLALHRIVMTEGPKNPDLAEQFIESGPLFIINLIVDYFKAKETKGLSVEHPEKIAQAIYCFIKGPEYMNYLFGIAEPKKDDLRQKAQEAAKLALKLIT